MTYNQVLNCTFYQLETFCILLLVRKSRSKPKRPPIEEDEDKSDGPVEVRYSGGNIPSRVFKVLQMSVGGSDPIEPTSSK